jgi:hypothetical protein
MMFIDLLDGCCNGDRNTWNTFPVSLKGTVSPDIYGPVLVCLDISELGWEPLMIFRSVWTSSELILIFNSLMRLMRKLLRLIMLLGVLLQITANPTWSGILQFNFPIGA